MAEGLSAETQAALREALTALDEHYTGRLLEIEREIRNLTERGEPITDLGDNTTEAGTNEAISILSGLGVSVE